MRIDKIFMLYENNGKYFNSYNEAYFNGKDNHKDKTVYYIFTPTMRRFSNTRDLYKHSDEYFKSVCDCDYLDLLTKKMYKQLSLI